MERSEPFDKVLQFDALEVGPEAVRLPYDATRYRRAIQISNCSATYSLTEVYVGYDAEIGPDRHIARLLPGGPPIEILARAGVPIWVAASQPATPVAFAEVR